MPDTIAARPAITQDYPLAGWSETAVKDALLNDGYAFSVHGNSIDADVVRKHGCRVYHVNVGTVLGLRAALAIVTGEGQG